MSEVSPTPVKFKKLVPDAILPQYAEEGDAGMDIFASHDAFVRYGEVTLVKTGLACELPPGMEFQVRPKSGLALKHGIMVVNTPGTVDCGYRGEIGVILTTVLLRYTSDVFPPFQVTKGMKIAQLVLKPVVQCKVVEAEELSESSRGTGGFGSTGLAAK